MLTPSPESLEEARKLVNEHNDDWEVWFNAEEARGLMAESIALALDRRAERARREDWRPIETATGVDRNGVIVAVRREGLWLVGEASFNPYSRNDQGAWWWANQNEGDYPDPEPIEPEFWQPLPEGPAILSSPAPGGEKT